MFQFIESICCVGRQLRNLDLHQNRVDVTRDHFFKNKPIINLQQVIKIPKDLDKDKYKVRIVYGEEIEKIEFLPYTIKKINTMGLINIPDSYDYKFKFLNRSLFDEINQLGTKDDYILIKNGKVTDALYSNLIFYDGNNWYTPKSCLLNGIMRQSLIKGKKIKEIEINKNELGNFTHLKRVNALMNFEEAEILHLKSIIN